MCLAFIKVVKLGSKTILLGLDASSLDLEYKNKNV